MNQFPDTGGLSHLFSQALSADQFEVTLLALEKTDFLSTRQKYTMPLHRCGDYQDTIWADFPE